MAASPVLGQETVPELELQEYQIIGRDTRVFQIEGDRKSSVWFVKTPLVLPEEKRSIESSQGLIGDEERQHRTPRFLITQGLTVDANAEIGAHSSRSAAVTASVNSPALKTVLRLDHRSAEEHSRNNRATEESGAMLSTYFTAAATDIGIHAGFVTGDDDRPDSGFRPGSRQSDRYTAGIGLSPRIFEDWDTSGDITVAGGTYTGFGASDEDESIVTVKAESTGDLYGTAATVSYDGEFLEIGGTKGSMSTIGGRGEWLFMDMLGVTLGADIHVWKAPGGDTEFTPAPVAKLDLAVTKHAYVRAKYGRSVIAHSFRDLYERNGLLTTDAATMLFEERSLDLDSEIGVRFGRGITVTAGAFVRDADNPPLYTAVGNFFDVPGGTEVKTTGYRAGIAWDHDGMYGLDASLTAQEATLANDDDAPFIPGSEVILDGWWKIYQLWTLRGSCAYFGSHAVDITDPSATEDGFFTVDIGVDRSVYKDNISIYLDLRNLTDSDGAWWTGQYAIPGIGLYLGVKAHY